MRIIILIRYFKIYIWENVHTMMTFYDLKTGNRTITLFMYI